MARAPRPNESPRFYFATARAYLRFTAIGQKQTPRSETAPHLYTLPKRMLLGFSLELYLKALLRNHGKTTDELQRPPFGHRIDEILAELERRGLHLSVTIRDAANQLGPMHADFGYRYVVDGSSYNDMDYRYIIGAICLLDELVAEQLGISDTHGIDIVGLPV